MWQKSRNKLYVGHFRTADLGKNGHTAGNKMHVLDAFSDHKFAIVQEIYR